MFINPNYVEAAVDRAGGLTQTAIELRVSAVTVHDWIKKQRIPKLDHARKLAKLAGVKVEDLRPVAGYSIF
jgi:hypothetical protein